MAVVDQADVTRRPESGAGSAAKAWQRALEMTAPIGRDPTQTLPLVIDAAAERFGASPALLSENETLSYAELSNLSRRYASWALRHSVGKGDVVALMMPNSPQYMAIWLGIVRVGGVAALVNTNLVGQSLQHSIEIVAPKHVIVDAALLDALVAIRPSLPDGVHVWAHAGDGHGLPRIEDAIGDADIDERSYPRPTLDDRALYIYTSGTTGLPKAAAVSHHRLMQWSMWFGG
jgi:fatty-acyl-CoA synthase